MPKEHSNSTMAKLAIGDIIARAGVSGAADSEVCKLVQLVMCNRLGREPKCQSSGWPLEAILN